MNCEICFCLPCAVGDIMLMKQKAAKRRGCHQGNLFMVLLTCYMNAEIKTQDQQVC